MQAHQEYSCGFFVLFRSQHNIVQVNLKLLVVVEVEKIKQIGFDELSCHEWQQLHCLLAN